MNYTELIYDENYWNDKKWFEFSQECLKNKFADIEYQCLSYEESLEIGYSGFNENGNVFIIICRGKITKENNKNIKIKLKDRINRIINIGGNGLFPKDFIINCITIITPQNLELCIKKYLKELEQSFNNDKLYSLGEKFKILFWDIQHFSQQIPIVLKSRDIFYDFIKGRVTENDVNKFSKENIEYIDNLHKKLEILLLENDQCDELNSMESSYILEYLQGKYLIDDLAENEEYLYDELMNLIHNNEKSIKIKSMKKQNDKIMYLGDVTNELEKKLIEEYNGVFHKNDIYEINNYVISDWLMRCPLNFR
ncbi:hypothetical protein [Clostridium sp.]|jgi:hypothetical protein|uniref:hypothetical protein n=1 Tax=Clostridium sp. TaxID=1506 RepID=UPI002FDCE646